MQAVKMMEVSQPSAAGSNKEQPKKKRYKRYCTTLQQEILPVDIDGYA